MRPIVIAFGAIALVAICLVPPAAARKLDGQRPNWIYRTYEGEAGRPATQTACSLFMAGPAVSVPADKKPAFGMLCFRYDVVRGYDSGLALNFDNFRCDKEPCHFKMKADGEDLGNVVFERPESDRRHFVFLPYEFMLSHVKGAKKIFLDVDLESIGPLTIEFKVENLVWPQPGN